MSKIDRKRPSGPQLVAQVESINVGDASEQVEMPLRPSVSRPTAKPVRSTIDLAPHKHASLKAWCGETALMIGRSRVTTQDIVSTLVSRLLTDETLARKIREDLKNQ